MNRPSPHRPFSREEETRQRLEKARQMIRMLEDELNETNSGLIALTVELEERASQLERAEEEYRTIFENAVEGMFRCTRAGRLLMANPSFARIFGFASPDQMAAAVSDVTTQLCGDPARSEELRRSLDAQGVLEGLEVCGQRSDGTMIWVEANLRVSRDASDRIVGYEGAVQDITPRKEAANALRKSEERYRLMVEGSTQVFFYIHDRDGRLEYLSPSVRSMLGYRPAELVGVSYEELLTDDVANDTVRLATEKTLRAGAGVHMYTAVVRHKQGHPVSIEVTESPLVRDGELAGVQGFARDVTERHKAEEELGRTEARLRHAQKMEAVGRLAGGVAHDFNNLLGVIGGMADMVLMDLPADAGVREDIEEIRRASQRAAGLTRQLLAFSRQQILQPEVLDLNAVILEVEAMLARVIGEDVDLDVNLGPDPCMIYADPGQVEQIVLNLAVNARDAMARGGHLTIETGVVDAGAAAALGSPEPLAHDGYCHLIVRDTGTGIPAEIQERIFEPFFTTKPVGQGTGIGLATVYGIVQQSAGQVWVRSEAGAGAEFHVLFPHSQEEAPRSGAGADPLALRPGSETVLLVEDDRALRSVTRKALARAGYDVLAAGDGPQAVELAARYEGRIDLLITDVVMPGMSGPEVADHLTGTRPGLRVLYTSGHLDDAMGRHGIAEEPAAFLPKPYGLATLCERVREQLDGA